jgi:hypothetical protein
MAGDRDSLPKLPRLKVDDIQLTRHSIQHLMRQRLGETLTPRTLTGIGQGIAEILDSNKPEHVIQTMIQYSGRALDQQLLDTLTGQIAGRESSLSEGPLVAYQRPTRAEWIAVEVQSLKPVLWQEDKPGVQFMLHCFNGHPAGHQVKHRFPESFLYYFAYRLGFSRRVEFDGDARHFIGLRFWGFMRPLPDSEEVRFEEWDLCPAFRKHNRGIIYLRTRHDAENPKAECPHDYEHHCFECSVRRTECRASCQVTMACPLTSNQSLTSSIP